MKIIDLHMHSTFTDGSYTPMELVDLAKRAGLSAMAITDHDNMAGFSEAKEYADKKEIKLLTGMEMSVQYRGEKLHILGLGFDETNPLFIEAYKKFRKVKESCVDELLERLKLHSVHLTREMIAPYALGAMDRYTIFRYLVAHKTREDAQYLWDDYLNPAMKGLNINIAVEEAISIIKDAGGVTSLAHCHKSIGLKEYAQPEKEECIKELCEMGLDGIEQQYPDFTKADQEFVEYVRTKYNLLPIGGTDFHGIYRPGLTLGRGKGNMAVPYAWYQAILNRCNKLD